MHPNSRFECCPTIAFGQIFYVNLVVFWRRKVDWSLGLEFAGHIVGIVVQCMLIIDEAYSSSSECAEVAASVKRGLKKRSLVCA